MCSWRTETSYMRGFFACTADAESGLLRNIDVYMTTAAWMAISGILNRSFSSIFPSTTTASCSQKIKVKMVFICKSMSTAMSTGDAAVAAHATAVSTATTALTTPASFHPLRTVRRSR